MNPRELVRLSIYRARCLWPIAIAGLICILPAVSPELRAQDTGSVIGSSPTPRIEPGLAFTMHGGSDSRVTLPRLTRFPDANVLNQVNADLDAESARLSHEAKECDATGKEKASWEETARVDLLTRDVLSVYVLVSYYCGRPHPDVEYDPLTYDLRTGRRFDFQRDAEQLFLGDAIPYGELTELYRKHFGEPVGDCDPSFVGPETGFILHFAANGLTLIPDVPHFAAACGPEITIPYREIKPLVKAHNPFASLFATKPTR